MLNQVLDFIEGPCVYCPRCLKRIPIDSNINRDIVCAECSFVIPLAYIRDYRKMPPVFVQLFGLTGAGKTTFLDMLRLYLMDMDQVWNNYFLQPITQLDKDHQEILLIERRHGAMPGSTQKRERNQNEAYILSLTHMPRWGSHFLVLMDHAGEVFDPLYLKMEDIPFLQHTPVTIFLLSLPDLEQDGRRVNDLLSSYITSLEACGINFAKEQRQLIIVFNKADVIPGLPRELRDYLNADTIYTSLQNRMHNLTMDETEIRQYIQRMAYVSDRIKKWVEERVQGGPAMINMLKHKGIVARFTVMSATGHPLSGNTVPLPRRVLDPFFWVMESYKLIRPQNVVRADVAALLSVFSPGLQTARFFVWLILLLLCTIGGIFYVSNVSHGDTAFVGFFLAAFLLFVCSVVNETIGEHDSLARSILMVTRGVLFLLFLALQALTSVQEIIYNTFIYQLFDDIILVAALFTLFQRADHFVPQYRVILATIAGMCALLQYTFGEQELPIFHFLPPAEYASTNTILIVTFVLLAIFALLQASDVLTWIDWAILFGVAAIYGAFQYAVGSEELLSIFPPSSNALLSAATITFLNVILAFIPIAATILFLVLSRKFQRSVRLPLLILAVICTAMFNFLGSAVKLPILPVIAYPLVFRIADLHMPGPFIEYGLIALSIILGARLLFPTFSKEFTFIDHAALFVVALVCAQLQTFSWGQPVGQIIGPAGTIAPLAINPALVAFFNQIIAGILTLLTPTGLGIIFVMQLLPLARQFESVDRILAHSTDRLLWTNQLTLWIERVVSAITVIGCAFLVDLYGQRGLIAPSTFYMDKVAITFYQIIAILFLILAVIPFRRINKPLTRGDRVLVLITMFFCLSFFFVKNKPLIPLTFVFQMWQSWDGNTPNVLFAFLLLMIAIVSFWWLRRSKFSGDRKVLQIIFGIALACAVLQLMIPSFLLTLFALVTLITGVMVARIAAGSTP